MVNKQDILPVNIETELKQSYLDYAMSVIVGRALPDIRDGLKPVHRRVLYSMSELGVYWNKPFKKSARIVGDIIGKYHPHGESAVYESIVRLAQPFSMRYTLVKGQGNFGSIDGDSAAASRYTEIRMEKISHSILSDLDKNTVDFVPNYDGTEIAPVVLPTRIPNLLVNGTSGIAVGMATNIPPHNLNEIIDACVLLIDEPNSSISEILKIVKGPDFPTAAFILGTKGIYDAYTTGKGRVVMRAKTHFEEISNHKQSIVIDELPYQVNKARLVEKIASLVRSKVIESISEIRDESDKDGIRVVIELKKNENPEIALNILYKHTQLQDTFSINMVALHDGQPKLLTLTEILNAFIQHRKVVVTRRTQFELKRAKEKCHILEGLGVSLNNIDKVIEIIKHSKTPSIAKQTLLETTWEAGFIASVVGDISTKIENLPEHQGLNGTKYNLSENQVQAILDLKLHRLTALEQSKINDEYIVYIEAIRKLLHILGSQQEIMNVVRQELVEVKEEFGDARRTILMEDSSDISLEDLIDPEDVVVTLSNAGYVKYQALTSYSAQKRGGKGKSATKVKDEDVIEKIIVANTHDTLLCFTNFGKVYWLKTYQISEASRISKGKPIINLLPLDKDEKITAILPTKDLSEDKSVFMATSMGVVKKVNLEDFSRPRNGGIRAIDLQDDDKLIGVDITDGNKDVMLFTDAGKVNRFHENDVRIMGRSARGVRGIRIPDGVKVTDLIVVKEEGSILITTSGGFGKRTLVSEFRKTGRGGVGVISIIVNERNGKALRSRQVIDSDEAVLITNQGTMVRIRTSEISLISRNTQGVKLMNVGDSEEVVDVQTIEYIDTNENEEEILS